MKSPAWPATVRSPMTFLIRHQLGAAGGRRHQRQPTRECHRHRAHRGERCGAHTITPSLLADGNIGYTRQSIGGRDVDITKNWGSDILKIPGTNGSLNLQGGQPLFSVSGLTGFGNTNVSNPFQFRDNQYTGVSVI